jgi:DNA-binding NtrC family response regulator
MIQISDKRTFLVDDDPFWTAILKKMLNELGYTNIHTFASANECMQHIHLNPHLVFLDYQMEEVNGIEALKQIKNYFPEIQVVFCTALEDISVAVDAIQNGSVEYLLKSKANLRELKAILNNVVFEPFNSN